MPGIIWLASYPKSGNTWMRAFLANLILDEPAALSLDRISEVCPGEANEGWFKPLVDRPLSDLTQAEVAALRCRAQLRAVSLNKHVIPMKTHSYLGEDHGHPIFSMEATTAAVYIVRDPRDVVLSAADHYGLSVDDTIRSMNDPEARGRPIEGNLVYERLCSWSMHVESWTRWNHPQIWPVRYEDLLSAPYERFVQLAAALGITKDAGRIRRAVEFASFKKLSELESEQGFAERSTNSERFFRVGESGRWRKVLTEKQVNRIERHHAAQMRRFGYL